MKPLITLINAVTAIAEVILGFRFFLRLAGASPVAPFVHWIYNASDPLLYPFRGIFPVRVLEVGSVFEFSTLFALVAYAILAYLLILLLDAIRYSVMRIQGPHMERRRTDPSNHPPVG